MASSGSSGLDRGASSSASHGGSFSSSSKDVYSGRAPHLRPPLLKARPVAPLRYIAYVAVAAVAAEVLPRVVIKGRERLTVRCIAVVLAAASAGLFGCRQWRAAAAKAHMKGLTDRQKALLGAGGSTAVENLSAAGSITRPRATSWTPAGEPRTPSGSGGGAAGSSTAAAAITPSRFVSPENRWSMHDRARELGLGLGTTPPITSPQQLERYYAERQQALMARPTGSAQKSSLFTSPSNTSVEYRKSMLYEKHSATSQPLDKREAAEQELEERNIDAAIMSKYVQNVRSVLAHIIKADILDPLDTNVGILHHKYGYPEAFLLRQDPDTTASAGMHRLKLDEMIQLLSKDRNKFTETVKNVTVHLWTQRLELEQYFEVVTGCDRAYVMHRLRELSASGNIGSFKWNSGSAWGGKPWDIRLPSDAEIILHVFSTMLDQSLRSYVPDEERPFTRRFRVDGANPKLMDGFEALVLNLERSNPPHVRLFSGSREIVVTEGRHNLFHALVLFLYEIHQSSNDHIDRYDASELVERVLQNCD